MIIVRYNGTPDIPRGSNHMCRIKSCIMEYVVKFDNQDQAVEFWLECTDPITTLSDILEWEDSTSDEELITCQRQIYELEESIFNELFSNL